MQIDKKTNFSAFEKALTLSQDEVIAQITSSGLRGMSGSNSPTGAKWESVRNNQNPNKLLICNADEGEPGTFKDVYILKHNPELLIEGMVIAAYAIGAKRAYIYLRTEYRHLVPALEEAIRVHEQELKRINLTLDIFQGAGAYICGEETSLINSIEGLRGEPRQKPPFPTEIGLWGQPTCVNNVTTLAFVPLIINDTYKPLYLFSLSGHVQQGGIYEFPLGVRAEELIDCGHPPRPIKALFFGAAGGCVPYSPDLKLDYDTIKSMGAGLGSCTVVAVNEDQSIPDVCRNLAGFFVHESCGKCTPCREGNLRVQQLLEKMCAGMGKKKDLADLEELAQFINRASFCGLGRSSNTHVLNALKYFRPEFEKLCP